MATYPASGTVLSNFGAPQGLLESPVKRIDYIVDMDVAASAKFVTGDVVNIDSIPAGTILLGGEAEVIDASVGGTAIPVTIACNSVTAAAFTTTQVNTAGTKVKAFPAPGANTVLAAAANLTFTLGTVTGTVTKNGKYRISLFLIKP